MDLEEAAVELPDSAVAKLRAGKAVEGEARIQGESRLFAAHPLRKQVVIATRPADLGADDFGPYLTALVVSGAIAALLAALTATLLARRIAAPLGRLADASRSLAAGRRPEPLPHEGPTEIAALSTAFNEMAAKLERAREAERSILLSVSHELKTPLTAIRGHAEGIVDETIEAPAAAEVVAREAGRLERLVQDLLALARLEQGVLEVVRERVDLGAIAREAAERLSPSARAAGVAVQVEADEGAHAWADHGRVLQVLSNLVENAVRVTPEGGQVTVTVAPGQLVVADTGPGIDPDEILHTFERFHLRRRTRHGSPDGAGLGLAIVRELTEAMDGSVSVESEPGKGACFTVRLPLE